MKKVFIDPGHGGNDPGAVAFGLIERDINLVTSFATKEVLERHGVEVKMSRYNNTAYVELSDRCKMANDWGADLFVSEHQNAGGGDRGEVIHSIYFGVGNTLADNVATELKIIGQTQVKNYSKQGRNGDYYAIIRDTDMPALISEGAFLDHDLDNDIIDTIEEQKIMGVAIAKGILKTLCITYVSPVVVASEIEEERNGFIMFNENYYLKMNPAVESEVKQGLFPTGKAHYDAYGKAEGRRAYPKLPSDFNEGAYLKGSPDVAKVVENGDYICGASHWVEFGWNEPRNYTVEIPVVINNKPQIDEKLDQVNLLLTEIKLLNL